MNNERENISTVDFANLMLDVGTYLLASGAHCGRVFSNLTRIASRWGFKISMNPSFKGLLVTVTNPNDKTDVVTVFKESPTHNVHLEILTMVSHLSWDVIEERLSFDETKQRFEQIKNTPHYNSWLVSLAVGLACAGLCFFSFGDILNAGVAFFAAFIGSIFRFKITAMNFNSMVSIITAAFVTTMITGLGSIYHVGDNPQAAMATAVLYLIPGVPLLNALIDLIEGYLSSAVNRSLFAGFILLYIAVGMTLSITIMGIGNF